MGLADGTTFNIAVLMLFCLAQRAMRLSYSTNTFEFRMSVSSSSLSTVPLQRTEYAQQADHHAQEVKPSSSHAGTPKDGPFAPLPGNSTAQTSIIETWFARVKEETTPIQSAMQDFCGNIPKNFHKPVHENFALMTCEDDAGWQEAISSLADLIPHIPQNQKSGNRGGCYQNSS